MSSGQSMSGEAIASQRDACVERFPGFTSGTFSLFSFAEFADRLWFGWFILATLVLSILTVSVLKARSQGGKHGKS